MTETRETQVLVIGGSLIGLTSSLLLSSLGVHHEVQATGIGDLWTRQNRWIHSLTGPQIAEVPTESFQMAPVDYSPSMPVMGAQDLIEETLWKAAREQPTADVRFHTIAEDLEREDDGCGANLRDRDSDQVERIRAQYVVVRPDGVVAAHTTANDPRSPAEILDRYLPLKHRS